MRLIALEIIGVAFRQNRHLIAYSHFQTATQDDPALLPLVRDGMFPGRSARLIALLEELHGTIRQVRTHLSERHAAVGDLSQLVCSIEDPVADFEFIAEVTPRKTSIPVTRCLIWPPSSFEA